MQRTSVDEDVRELLQESEEAARDYLVVSFVSAAMRLLYHARRDAGLSQEGLSGRLGTKQSAIARWERDHEGSITLSNYARFLSECGAIPFDLELSPVSEMRKYALDRPSEFRTVENVRSHVSSIIVSPAVAVENSSRTYVMAGHLKQMTTGENCAVSGPVGNIEFKFTKYRSGVVPPREAQRQFVRAA